MKSIRMTFTLVLLGLAASGIALADNHKASETPSQHATQAAPSIAGVAAGDANFSTLVAALKAADLVATLDTGGPFTVFAPTNDAFAKLPAGTLESLLKPENKEQLKGILLYHVVSGKVTAADVVKLSEAKTVQGKSAPISTEGGVSIAGAKVVKTDIAASNGVIHVIDTVILP